MPLGKALLVARILVPVAVRVLIAVQVLLEFTVVDGDQRLHSRQAIRCEPALRIVLRQRPVHDLQALLDHPAAG